MSRRHGIHAARHFHHQAPARRHGRHGHDDASKSNSKSQSKSRSKSGGHDG